MTDISPTPPRHSPVAVIGMSCRLPAAANLDEFRRAPHRAVTCEPAAAPRLDGIDLFDSAWFGIPDAEAAVLDPRQRLALEAVVEAIDDAGIGYRMRGSSTAVVVTIGAAPGYGRGRPSGDIAHGISHVLGLHGPGATSENSDGEPGWAEAAVRAFEDASVPFVIVAGVDIEIAGVGGAGSGIVGVEAARVEVGVAASPASAPPLPDERDAVPVSGILWRAGCGVLILQRLADAVRTGSRVHAEIEFPAADSPARGIRSSSVAGAGEPGPADLSRHRGELGRHGSAERADGSPPVTGSRPASTSVTANCSGPEHSSRSASSSHPAAGHRHTGGSLPARVAMPATRSVMSVIERVCALADDRAAWTAGDRPVLRGPEPGTSRLGTSVPDTSGPCTFEPGTSGPGTSGPGTSGPGTSEPGTSRPDKSGPGSSRPDTSRPGTSGPGIPEPGASEPETSRPSTPEPGASSTSGSSTSTWVAPLAVRPARVGRSVRAMDPPVLITVTGRDDGEFRNAAMRLVHHLRYAAPEGDRAAESAALQELSAATTRSFPNATRGAVLAGDAAQARDRLRALAQGEPGAGIVGPRTPRRRDGVLFLFTGTVERPARLGRALAARYPVFAAALNEITDAVVTAGGPRIWTPRFGFHPPATGCAERELGLLAGFVHQVALARLVESWGVRPDAVCGYGFGELAAALVAGVLTTGDAAGLAVWRAGRTGVAPPDERVSALVNASPEEVARLIEPLRPAVTVAAMHGPRSVLVRGEPRQVETIARRAERRGLSVTLLERTDSDPVVPETEHTSVISGAQASTGHIQTSTGGAQASADAVRKSTGGVRMGTQAGRAGVRTSTGTVRTSRDSDQASRGDDQTNRGGDRARGSGDRLAHPAPWGLATPRLPFYSTVRAGQVFSTSAPDARYWTEEVGGAVQLAAAMERAAHDGVGTVLEFAAHPVLTTALREYPEFRNSAYPVGDRDDEVTALLLALAELHADGRFVEWSGHGPFTGAAPRRRWRRTPVRSPLPLVTDCAAATVDAEESGEHALGTIALVPTGYWVRTLLRLAAPAEMMTDFVVHDRLGPDALGAIECRDDGPAGIRAYIGDLPVVSARPMSGPAPADIVDWMRVVDTGRSARHRMRELGGANFYTLLRRHRLDYGPRRRVLAGLETGAGHAFGTVETVAASLVSIIEGCVHLLVAAAQEYVSDRTYPSVPAISAVWVGAGAERLVTRAYATVRERGPDSLTGDVVGTDDDGVPVLALSGVRIVFAERDAAARDGQTEIAPFRTQVWLPTTTGADGTPPSRLRRLLIVGASETAARLARSTDLTVATEHVARTPDAAGEVVWAAAEAADPPTGIVLIWPDSDDPDPAAALARAHEVLTCAATAAATAGLTVVLPRRALRGSGGAATAWGVAALTRTLRLESRRRVRVVWADADPRALGLLADLVTIDAPGGGRSRTLVDTPDTGTSPAPGEPRSSASGAGESETDVLWSGDLRVGTDGLAVRRFRQAPAVTSPAPRIDPGGTYVVTGGLGRRGAIAVRWLLDEGAHDVVVLTRDPRPVPGPLDGLEDRFVVVRCDVADRAELAGALDDIREYGSTIRGVVHAAEDFEPTRLGAVTQDHLARLFAPKAEAARHLLELTAADPIDFVLLFSSAAGALGARNQAAYAAASAAVDALAAGSRRRRVLALGWEIRQSDGAMATMDNDSAKVAHGAHVLTQALRSGAPHLLVNGETGSDS
ncbi:KR domain-containing protein [Nocardia shimofusensis]|uniref:KR domain-containing protein n=1 Tax=Nocardia shimofusensis TaxID=228596 RepID=UPI00083020BA|nr:KR domain-containing protein [Nocardia shimofusensis]